MHGPYINWLRASARALLGGLLLGAALLGLTQSVSAESNSCLTLHQQDPTPRPAPAAATAPNCRYGVSASSAAAEKMAEMKIGWLVSFGAGEPGWLPAGTAHTPMIRLKQDRHADTNARLPSYTANPSLTANSLGSLIAANPGAVWIVGNEVDRVQWQDDLMPEIYAVAYHDAYQFIKSQDPTAQVAVSALVQVSPGRLQYLDKVVAAYRERYGSPMPVDAWTFHAYIFPERNEDYYTPDANGNPVLDPESGKPVFAWIANGTDPALALKKPFWKRPLAEQLTLCERSDYSCIYEHDKIDLFAQQVIDMRTWMKANGYQRTPLLLTEWSLLYEYKVAAGTGECSVKDEFGNCFTPARTTEFLRRSVQYMETASDPNLGYPLDNNRLVQQWSWFAMDDLGGGIFTDGNPSLLVDPDSGNLTQAGEEFGALIAQSTTQPNLVIDEVLGGTTSINPETDTATAQLKVLVRNNGNTPTTVPFTVEFYRGTNPANAIGETVVPAGLDGCAVVEAVAEVTWAGLTAPLNTFTVAVDPDNAAGSSGSAGSRRTSSFVLVDPSVLYLPTLLR